MSRRRCCSVTPEPGVNAGGYMALHSIQRLRAQVLGWLLLLSLGLTACGRAPEIEHQQAYVFGTLVELSVPASPQAGPAMAAVLARFDALHRQLHAWQPSELSRLNAAIARGERLAVSPELVAMLKDAQRYSLQSGGRFNPAIGHLIALWGFQSDTPATHVPPAAAIARWVAARPAMTDLRFDGNTVWSVNPAVKLDLGGYAKGYALDQAAAILRAHGIANALVNIGGNVLALGRAGERPWRVGIQDPRGPGTLASLDLHDGEALGTSGDYQRYFAVDGVRYCHLIDPASGRPAHALQSVTVLTRGAHAGVRSDVLSKPLFIGDAAHWETRAAQLGLNAILIVTADGTRQVSPALAARLR